LWSEEVTKNNLREAKTVDVGLFVGSRNTEGQKKGRKWGTEGFKRSQEANATKRKKKGELKRKQNAKTTTVSMKKFPTAAGKFFGNKRKLGS